MINDIGDKVRIYFDEKKPGHFKCKNCGAVGIVKTKSLEPLKKHMMAKHQEIIMPTVIDLDSSSDNANENESERSEAENGVYDEWVDRLALDGYPIGEIISSMIRRYNEDSVSFGKYLSRRASSVRNCKYKTKNFLPRLPINLLPSQIVPMLVQKYRISTEASRLLVQQFFWCNQDPTDIYYAVESKGNLIKIYNQHVVSFATPTMQQNYHQFADTMYFHTLQISLVSGTRYVIVLYGFDTNLAPALFAICISDEQSVYTYSRCLEMLFHSVDQVPVTVVSNMNQYVEKAIKQYNKNYEKNINIVRHRRYLWDKLHQKVGQKQKWLLRRALQALTCEEFADAIYGLKLCKYQQVEQLLQYKAVPPLIVWQMIDLHTPLQQLIQGYYGHVKTLGYLFLQGIRLEEQLLRRLNRGFALVPAQQLAQITQQTIYENSQIRYLSRRMEAQPLYKLLSLYNSAQSLTLIPSHPLLYMVQEEGKTYSLSYSLPHHCWRCNCLFIYYFGLPCHHLIKVIKHFGGLFSYYVNRRWFIYTNNYDSDMLHHVEYKPHLI